MTVQFYGNVIDQAKGAESFTPQNSETLRMLVAELSNTFGPAFRDFLLSEETCFFLINGKGIMTTGGLDTKLHPGDKIEILPFVEAG